MSGYDPRLVRRDDRGQPRVPRSAAAPEVDGTRIGSGVILFVERLLVAGCRQTRPVSTRQGSSVRAWRG